MTIFLVILAVVLMGATALLASGREVTVLRRRAGGRGTPPSRSRAADGSDGAGGSEDAAGQDTPGTSAGDGDRRPPTPDGDHHAHPGDGRGRPGTGDGDRRPGEVDGLGMVEPVASLPPVLLPDDPSAADVDAVRFGLGLRGYRMDQVDEVLDRLSAALAARDAVIRVLRAELAGRDGQP